MKKELRIDATLIEGGGGIFDIYADDDPVYLKSETGEFPDDQDVVRMLKERK